MVKMNKLFISEQCLRNLVVESFKETSDDFKKCKDDILLNLSDVSVIGANQTMEGLVDFIETIFTKSFNSANEGEVGFFKVTDKGVNGISFIVDDAYEKDEKDNPKTFQVDLDFFNTDNEPKYLTLDSTILVFTIFIDSIIDVGYFADKEKSFYKVLKTPTKPIGGENKKVIFDLTYFNRPNGNRKLVVLLKNKRNYVDDALFVNYSFKEVK